MPIAPPVERGIALGNHGNYQSIVALRLKCIQVKQGRIGGNYVVVDYNNIITVAVYLVVSLLDGRRIVVLWVYGHHH